VWELVGAGFFARRFLAMRRVSTLQNRKTPLDLVYGTTEMCRPDEFLAQFAELGAAKMR
jgi:hypothetical protein